MSKELFDVLISQWQQFADLDEVEQELENIQLIPVASSNLGAVGYDKNKHVLLIAFLDGSIYRYEGVPPEEYKDLMTSDSHGEYFYDNIREVYPYERVIG